MSTPWFLNQQKVKPKPKPKLGISWTKKTWNPITGCLPIATGCKNCYAKRISRQLQLKGVKKYEHGFKPQLHDDNVDAPRKIKKPCSIFICSMSDYFIDIDGETPPMEFYVKVFDTIRACPQHVFQILTKRPHNMVKIVNEYQDLKGGRFENVWFGISASTQADIDTNIVPFLKMQGRGAGLFMSIEPILEDNIKIPYWIDWVIVGGESGPNMRISKLEWIRFIKKQCRDYNIPIHIKQLHTFGGRLLENPDDFPEDLQHQEFPQALLSPMNQTLELFK